MPDTSTLTFNFDLIPADLKTKVYDFLIKIAVLLLNMLGSAITLILDFITDPIIWGILIVTTILWSLYKWSKRKGRIAS